MQSQKIPRKKPEISSARLKNQGRKTLPYWQSLSFGTASILTDPWEWWRSLLLRSGFWSREERSTVRKTYKSL
jgi:hypothetical protein